MQQHFSKTPSFTKHIRTLLDILSQRDHVFFFRLFICFVIKPNNDWYVILRYDISHTTPFISLKAKGQFIFNTRVLHQLS